MNTGMNSSKASSFNPYEYYQKLTKCIAKKKNFKVGLKYISSNENRAPRCSKPMITKEYMEAKFLAESNNRTNQKAKEKLELENLKKAEATTSSKYVPEESQNKIKIGKKDFVVKMKQTKKKKDEPYINLPASFFKPFNLPSDTSLFKMPKALSKASTTVTKPEKKMLKLPEPQVPQHPASTFLDFTMNSLNSINFDPNVASTPIEEKKKPMFSEPAEVASYFTAIKKPAELAAFDFDVEARKVLEIVSNAVDRIGSTCFATHPDPIIDIHGRIMEIYEASCRSPRLMNETLMSSASSAQHVKIPSVDSSSFSVVLMPKYVLPDQKVFEEKNDEEDVKEDGSENGNEEFNGTEDFFNWTASDPIKSQPVKRRSETFAVKSPVNTFNQSSTVLKMPEVFSPDNDETLQKLFSQDTPDICFQSTKEAVDDPFNFTQNLFNFSSELSNPFDESLMDWDSQQDKPMDNSYAVFRSPPSKCKEKSRRSRRSQSKPRNAHRSQESRRSHKSRHSSRHSRNSESISKKSESTLSSYVWTPKLKLFSPPKQLDETETYFLEPREIFKNSFNFF